MTWRPRSTAAIGLVLTVLVLLAVLAASQNLVLTSSLGLAVAVAGLFLSPLATASAGAAAVALALLVLSEQVPSEALRLVNVVVGSALGILVSWRRRQEVAGVERMRKQEAALLASVADGVVLLDDAGRVVQANEALLGLVPSATVGQRLHPLLAHTLADGSPCPGGCVLDGRWSGPAPTPSHQMALESVSPAARRIPVEYLATQAGGRQIAVTLRDCTDRERAEADRLVHVESATREAEQRRVLEALGYMLHPELPAVAGFDLDVWSRPADPHAPSGGDLVDVSELADDSLLVLLVDALGYGVTSVRDGWKVLFMARALLTAGVPLGDVIGRAARALALEPEPPTATVLATTLDPVSGAFRLASGGHPPPLLVRTSGASHWLEARGRGLGTPEPGSDDVLTGMLDPGDLLVLYTDGLVESDRDVVAGLSALRASATALRHEPSAGWAKRLGEALLDGGPAQDDTIVLLVRRQPPSEEQGLTG